MREPSLPITKHRADYVQFSGGLDVVSPMVAIPPGFVRNSQNIEEDINGGYATLMGYERFDGRKSPSAGTYALLNFTVKGTVAVGNTITGATSAATGVVIAITSTAFVITKITGTWATENTVSAGASVVGPVKGGVTGETAALYTKLAANYYRSLILPVPGTGNILGVHYYKGVVYAFRNAVSSGVGMYQSTSSGWQAVALNYEIAFINANISVVDAAILTQGAVTASIKRVVVETGTLVSGTNTGRLIIAVPAGGNFAAAAATSTGGGTLILSAVQTAITIPNQNGRFEFFNANFNGWRGSYKMYGCDGANRLFEFDGTTFVPIHVGLLANLTEIFPAHIAFHQQSLFVSYLSSALFSAIGNPYNFTTTAGGGEIALGNDVTGFKSQPGATTTAALAIYCRNKTSVLYGTGSSGANSFSLITLNDQAGAIPWSIQKIGETYIFDDRGITNLTTTLNFGNFTEATVSKRVKTWLAAKRTITTDSYVARDKQQYRLFFSDGSAAYWTLRKDDNGNSSPAMMPILFPNPVLCSVSDEIYGGGDEVIFFGSRADSLGDAYVYQMERGTSFDGAAITWFADLAFNHSKSYRTLKKYRRMTFEMTGTGYAVFQSSYSLSYGQSDSSQPENTFNAVSLAIAQWDSSFVWDQFIWDGQPIQPLSMSTPGDGENISLHIGSSGDYYNRLKFSGCFIEFSQLRMLR